MHAGRDIRQADRTQALQHPGKDGAVCFKIDRATGARNGRVVRGRIFQIDAQKVAQGEGVRRAPRDAALQIDPFEIANKQQPEVHAWRQARPSHDFRIE